MKKNNILLALTVLLIITSGCGGGDGNSDSPPNAKVFNRSGKSLQKVNVGGAEFVEYMHLENCLDCATYDREVPQGSNEVTLVEEFSSTTVSLGTLDSFINNTSYSVNIRQTEADGFCAELWTTPNATIPFWNDPSAQLLSTTCTENIVKGVWLLENTDEEVAPGNYTVTYFVADNDGNLTDVGGFNNGPGAGSYQILNSNVFELTIVDTVSSNSATVTCTRDFPTSGTCTAPGIAEPYPLKKLTDPAGFNTCQGNWIGTFIDGTTSTAYNLDFTVDANGVIAWNGAPSTTFVAPVTGRMFCEQLPAGFLRTGSNNPYDQLRFNGAVYNHPVDGTVFEGTYERDDGPSFNDGNVYLIKQ